MANKNKKGIMTACSNTKQVASLHDINVENLDILLWPLLVCSRILNLMNHIQALCRTSENGVFSIQPRLCAIQSQLSHLFLIKRNLLGQILTVFSVVMKNWLAFVLGPAFAMLTV